MNLSWSQLFWLQFWQITLLIPVVILLVRYKLAKAPHLAYGLLLVVLLKTMFPPIWDFPTGVFWELVAAPFEGTLTPDSQLTSDVAELGTATQAGFVVLPDSMPGGQSSPQQQAAEATGDNPLGASDSAISTAMVSDLPSPLATASLSNKSDQQFGWLLAAIWMGGSVLLLGYIVGKRAQLIRFHLDTRVEPNVELVELVELVSAELGLVDVPDVLVTLHPTVPFASGWRQKYVVLPVQVIQETPAAELKLILAHEMTHLRRGDTLVGLLQLTVQVLWWFHPLVYWLNFEIRRVREECCDSDVVTQLGCPPASYARCLLNLLESRQRLRPGVELVGLSPLEVTAKRMENIMRSPRSPQPRRQLVLQVCGILGFALFVLPASADSFQFPKVIVGDLVPAHAQKELRPAPPAAVPESPPRSKRPRRADESTETPPAQSPSQRPASPSPPESQRGAEHAEPPPATPPQREPRRSRAKDADDNVSPSARSQAAATALKLEYQWQQGTRHPYAVELEAQYPSEIIRHQGRPTWKVEAYAAGIPAFTLLNESFSREITPRGSVTLPTLPQLEAAADDFPGFSVRRPFPFRPPSSPFSPESSRSVFVTGSNPHTNPATGELPYLLGSLTDWVFPQLPVPGEVELRRASTLMLELREPHTVQISPFEAPLHEKLPVTVRYTAKLTDSSETHVTLATHWVLTSDEQIDGAARREVALSGEVRLRPADGFPLSATYAGRLIERETHREYRIPLSLTIRRIEPPAGP